MLETAIIGAGLSGLALARSLYRQGRSFAVFEARPRLGGRILSVVDATSGLAVDLGPTWFWSETQPLVTQLIADVGLSNFLQHDQGDLLHLREPDKKPDVIADRSVHNGARRVDGGMARLIDTLAGELPSDQLHLQHILVGLRDCEDHVALAFHTPQGAAEIAARRVVLMIPPRLLEQQVRFEPDVEEAMRTAMRNAGTWMAAQAKVTVSYARPYWREAGQSGNAFVTHEQAVVGEIFDACNVTATKAALGGFLALSPDLRQAFSAGLPLLIGSQMAQVFGSAVEQGELHYQDWATEPYTCSALDRSSPVAEHSGFANPLLRREMWGGKLYLGGSETASQNAGYLEGALEAARRVHRALGRVAACSPKPPACGIGADDTSSINAASLAWFTEWVSTQSDATFEGYRQRLNRSLAAQQREQVTQRAMVASIEDVYGRALQVLEALDFDMSAIPIERGRSALMPDVQKPFRDVMQTLLDDVIAFNRTSCALSNFPDEQHPSKDYVQAMLRDVAAAWQEFSLSANRLLLAKAREPVVRSSEDRPVMISP